MTRPKRRLIFLLIGLAIAMTCFVGPILVLVLPLFWFASGVEEMVEPIDDARRTVVLIAVDDLRRDHLAFHGYKHDPTPVLSALASRGVAATDYVPASTATTASFAALLTGLGPADSGLWSARNIGAHRLPGGATILFDDGSTHDFRSLGALALPQVDDRLSGLARGIDAWTGVAPPAPPLTGAELLEQLDAMEHADMGLRDPGDLLLVVHLADLREETAPPVDRLPTWLRRHLDAHRSESDELAVALDRLRLSPEAAMQDIANFLGRRRGSAAWSAWQDARYDARLAELDATIGALMERLDDAGRGDALVVVAGTRGRLLGVEPPEGGAGIELAENVVKTALVAAGPAVADDKDRWRALDRAEAVHRMLSSSIGDNRFRSSSAVPAGGPRTVCAANGRVAVLDGQHKDIFAPGGERVCFDRATDLAVDPCNRPAPADLGVSGWSFGFRSMDVPEFDLYLASPSGDIAGARRGEEVLRVSESGKALTVRVAHENDVLAILRKPVGTLKATIRADGGARVQSTWGVEQAGARSILGTDVPVFPPNLGDESDRARITLTADGAWTEVAVAGEEGEPYALTLWVSPPDVSPPEVEVVGATGDRVPDVQVLPGLGAIRVEGAGAGRIRVKRRAGQEIAVAARIDGDRIPASAMTSDKGGSPNELTLLLPPVDVGRIELVLGADTRLFCERRYPGAPLEGPWRLTEDDVRFLRRLGPLE